MIKYRLHGWDHTWVTRTDSCQWEMCIAALGCHRIGMPPHGASALIDVGHWPPLGRGGRQPIIPRHASSNMLICNGSWNGRGLPDDIPRIAAISIPVKAQAGGSHQRLRSARSKPSSIKGVNERNVLGWKFDKQVHSSKVTVKSSGEHVIFLDSCVLGTVNCTPRSHRGASRR